MSSFVWGSIHWLSGFVQPESLKPFVKFVARMNRTASTPSQARLLMPPRRVCSMKNRMAKYAPTPTSSTQASVVLKKR